MKTEDRTERSVVFKPENLPEDDEFLEVALTFEDGKLNDICVREGDRLTLMISDGDSSDIVRRARLIVNLLNEAIVETEK